MGKLQLGRRDPHACSKLKKLSKSSSDRLKETSHTTVMSITAASTTRPSMMLLMPQEIAEGSSMVNPEILPDLLQSFSLEEEKGETTVPSEVTTLIESPRGVPLRILPQSQQDDEDLERKAVQAVESYTEALEEAQQQIQKLKNEVDKSQSRAKDLLKQNKRLMANLKGSLAKDQIDDEYRALKQELILVKVSLLCGVLYIWYGGRADIVGLLALMWLVVDFST